MVKANNIKNLAIAVKEGINIFDKFVNQNDFEVIRDLTRLNGIGLWTAKMYLIFVLNRNNVLPYEDMAFIQAYSWMYKTTDVSRESIEKRCKKWSPYASIGARYLYKALDSGLTKKEFHLFKD